MTQEEFLAWERASRDIIVVKRLYIDIAGDLPTGIMLSQIIYWHLPNKFSETKLRIERAGRQWLAKRRKDWWDECRITPKQVDRCLSKLVQKDIIATRVFKFAGDPVKHISLNWEVFLSLIGETTEKFVLTEKEKTNLPLSIKRNSFNRRMVILEKARTNTTENTAENTSHTTAKKMDVDKSEEYNAQTVSVPLPPESLQQLITSFSSNQPWKVYHAAHVLNWKVKRGYKPEDYASVIAGMLRRGVIHPDKCLSPSEIRIQEQTAVEKRLFNEARNRKKDEDAKADEAAFDALPPEDQASFISTAKQTYSFIKAASVVKAHAILIYIKTRGKDRQNGS